MSLSLKMGIPHFRMGKRKDLLGQKKKKINSFFPQVTSKGQLIFGCIFKCLVFFFPMLSYCGHEPPTLHG